MKISRRTMLSGFGVSLGLPLLDAMAPRIARSDVENRTRMVVFNTPNGFYRPAMALVVPAPHTARAHRWARSQRCVRTCSW